MVEQKDGEIDLAKITDGLKKEVNEGITVDAAYRYFMKNGNKYVLADCPGHKEYIKNMFTGMSNSDIALLLVDAHRGITDQTRRHIEILLLSDVDKVIVGINKMDLVNWDESVYNERVNQIEDILDNRHDNVLFVPISALHGDNVVNNSDNMAWYSGKNIMKILLKYKPVHNNVKIITPLKAYDAKTNRAVVQFNEVPQNDYVCLSDIRTISTFAGNIVKRYGSLCVIEVTSGNVLTDGIYHRVFKRLPIFATAAAEAKMFWFGDNVVESKTYIVKTDYSETECALEPQEEYDHEVSRWFIKATNKLYFKKDTQFILIDPTTNGTIAAGHLTDRDSQKQNAPLLLSIPTMISSLALNAVPFAPLMSR